MTVNTDPYAIPVPTASGQIASCVRTAPASHAHVPVRRSAAPATNATRLVARMDCDRLARGHCPAGVCGAALLLAARMNGFRRSVPEVVPVVKIADHTVRRHLEELRQRKYEAFPKNAEVKKAKSEEEEAEADAEDGEDTDSDTGARDYDYLLSVSRYSPALHIFIH